MGSAFPNSDETGFRAQRHRLTSLESEVRDGRASDVYHRSTSLSRDSSNASTVDLGVRRGDARKVKAFDVFDKNPLRAMCETVRSQDVALKPKTLFTFVQSYLPCGRGHDKTPCPIVRYAAIAATT
jgi:hypothetical protein